MTYSSLKFDKKLVFYVKEKRGDVQQFCAISLCVSYFVYATCLLLANYKLLMNNKEFRKRLEIFSPCCFKKNNKIKTGVGPPYYQKYKTCDKIWKKKLRRFHSCTCTLLNKLNIFCIFCSKVEQMLQTHSRFSFGFF